MAEISIKAKGGVCLRLFFLSVFSIGMFDIRSNELLSWTF